MKKAFIIFASLMVCIFLLFSCGPAEETTTTTQATTSTTTQTTTTTAALPVSVLECPQGPPTPGLVPQYSGTLKIIYDNNPTNLGTPWNIGTPADSILSRFAIENLVGLDTLGKPIPQLATGWDADPVGMSITFTLRQGVKFHDGTPFNAAAAKWCLDKYRSGKKTDLNAVTAVDVIDDYHIKLTLSSWDTLFIQSLSSSNAGRMVSPTAAQKLIDAGKESDILLNPVGTGPFKFVSFQPSVSLKYTRFDDYWQKGLPYLDAVEISIVADKVVALTSFTKGEADVFYGVSTTDAKDLKDKGNTIKTSTLTIMGICGDSKNENSPFYKEIVREAIAYAIPVDTIVNTVFGGMCPPTNQLALPGFQGYDSSIQGYPYNPEKAKDLLKIAGYDTTNPLETKFTYMSDPQRADLFTLVQSYLAKVGINITLEPISFAAFNKFNQAGWNNQLIQYSFSYNGLEMQYSTSMLNNLYGGKLSYVSVYAPPAFDALFATAKAETDLDKRETYYQQLNKMAIDDYCLVIPLFGFVRLTANSPKVHDCGFAYRAPIEFLPETVWLSQ